MYQEIKSVTMIIGELTDLIFDLILGTKKGEVMGNGKYRLVDGLG